MTRASWSRLPAEILLNIFQRNDNNAKNQCSLTCRDWKYTAQLTLFYKMKISSEKQVIDLSNTLSIYQNNSHNANFGQSPGNHVKIVDCRFYKIKLDWELVDELFPFVEFIKFYSVDQSKHYKRVSKLLLEGRFPHLKQVPTISCNKNTLKILLDRRERIEELELSSEPIDEKIRRKLHLFPNLKIFDLEYTNETELEYIFNKDILHVKSISVSFGSRNLVTSTRNIDEIQPFPNTRELKIDCNEYTLYNDKFILYIMKKFPNLEKLSLDNDPNFYKYNYAFPTVDCLFQFLIYLSKMKKDSSAVLVTNDITAQLLNKFFSYQPTVYYKNTNISLDVLLNFTEPEQEHHNYPDITGYVTDILTIKNRKRGGCKKDECNLTVNYRVMEEATFRPYSQLFREIGNINITRLKITNGDSTPEISVVLDEIFVHFSKLENIEISDISKFISNKEECLAEERFNSTIKYMQYMKCTLTKDMFPMISRLCQNLKTLNLTNCEYTNSNEDKTITRYFPIIMPSTCLEELIISLNNSEEFEYEKAFIRLITNNKKPRYCKVTTKPGEPIVNFPEQDCTEAHYNMCLHDEQCGVFDIHCESVVKLTVLFETEFCQLDDCIMITGEQVENEVCHHFKKKEYIEEDF